jgi:hypothetical protein
MPFVTTYVKVLLEIVGGAREPEALLAIDPVSM